MTMNTDRMKWIVMVMALSLALLASCGGEGGGTGGSGSVISGKVPYLVSGPSVSFRSHPTFTTQYNVTVTLEADGPTRVYSALVWITDENDWTNATPLDLVNTTGKLWTGTTEVWSLLTPGKYHIDEIMLDDGDWQTASQLGTGWYFIMPPLSTSVYYVDERITSNTTVLYYGGGLTSRPVSRFTLP